jgi:hypothetical protein
MSAVSSASLPVEPRSASWHHGRVIAELHAAAGLLIAAVVVEGPSECPTPAAVQERLAPLLPPDTGRGASLVELVNEPDGLRISLRRADGTLAGTRTIGGVHSCDELADAAAVMIAAWQTDAAAGEPAPAPPPPPVAPPVAAVKTAPPAAPPPASPAVRWELGAGGGASLSGNAIAPAALLLGEVSAGGPLGLAARASVSGNREVVLPGGGARWRRALFALGPRLQLVRGRALAQAHLGAGVSWLAIAAHGYPDARRHDDLMAGLSGGLRVGWSRAGARPWVDLGAAFWPVRSILYQLPDERTATLPRLELLLTLGLSFSR